MINLFEVAQDLYDDIKAPANGGNVAQPDGQADGAGLNATSKADMAAIMARPLGYKSGTIFRFDHADNETNYVTASDGTIKAASLSKLIEKLTSKTTDPNLLFEFLLTYRSFCTPLELMDGLVQRFSTAMGPDRDVVRLRVVSVFKTWIDKHWNDFSKEEILGATFEEFVAYLCNLSGFERPGDALKKTYLRRKTGGLGEQREHQFSVQPPKPIIPSQMPTTGLDLLEIHPEELARQLTLIDYEYYQRIRPWECLAWNKKNKEQLAPNIIAMINRFNEVSQWVASEICRQENLKKRVKVLQKFIEVAEKLNKPYNNFNAVMEIIAGLNSSAVHRLKQTFSALPQRTTATYNELCNLVQQAQNYHKLRHAIHSCSPPCIPYLGMYLTDLTFIEDGNKDLTDTGLINFNKRKQIANVIREIIQYQQTPYCLEPVPIIQEYLKKLVWYDEETNYRLSTYLEPKPGQMRPNEKPIELMTPEELKAAGITPTGVVAVFAGMAKSTSVDDTDYDAEFIHGYKFYPKDSPSNIVIEVKDGTQIIHAATVEKLVERLTDDKSVSETRFTNSFLATFREFLTTHEFLDLLIMRWNIPKPKNPTPENMEKYKNKETPIRLRVFNILKTWIDRHSHDFRDDSSLLDKLQNFNNTEISKANPKWAASLQSAIQKAQGFGSSHVASAPIPPPKEPSVQSKPINEISIVDLDTEEVAKQLALITYQYYCKITPTEMLRKRWAMQNAYAVAPNVLAFYGLQDKIGYNIEVALSKLLDSPAELTLAIARWIEVAEHSAQLKNWAMARTIIRALEQLFVKELLSVWQAIQPQSLKQQFLELQKTYKDKSLLKSRIQTGGPPCLPVLEIYLEELAQIEEKYPDKVSDVLINFDKYHAMSDILLTLQDCQRFEFMFATSDLIRRWLLREPQPNELPKELASQKFKNSAPIDPPQFLAPPPVPTRPAMGSPPPGRPTPPGRPIPPAPTSASAPAPAPAPSQTTVHYGSSPQNSAMEALGKSNLSSSDYADPQSLLLETASEEENERRMLLRMYMKTSPELREEVLGIMREIALEQFQRIQREIELDKEANQNNASSALSEFYQLIQKEFPGCKLTRWTYNDKEGKVFGFPEVVECDMIRCGTDNYLCEIRSEVHVSDVALLLRIGRLYKSLNPQGSLACVIFTRYITPQALRIATKCKIKIFGTE